MSNQINRQLFQFIEKTVQLSRCGTDGGLTENGFTELREQEAWKSERAVSILPAETVLANCMYRTSEGFHTYRIPYGLTRF